MTRQEQDLEVARERLGSLQRRVERIVIDPSKPRRVKDMELAGVNGMIQQVESEIRALAAGALCEQVDALRVRLRGDDARTLGEVVEGALDLVEQLAMQKT